jgi:hypothetical protein
MSTTARFALPLIAPGQAQKEVYHNEALTAVDAALHACIEGSSLTERRAPGRAVPIRSRPGPPGGGASRRR